MWLIRQWDCETAFQNLPFFIPSRQDLKPGRNHCAQRIMELAFFLFSTYMKDGIGNFKYIGKSSNKKVKSSYFIYLWVSHLTLNTSWSFPRLVFSILSGHCGVMGIELVRVHVQFPLLRICKLPDFLSLLATVSFPLFREAAIGCCVQRNVWHWYRTNLPFSRFVPLC